MWDFRSTEAVAQPLSYPGNRSCRLPLPEHVYGRPKDELVIVQRCLNRAKPPEIEAAVTAAGETFQVTRRLPSWKRSDVLERIRALTFAGSSVVGWELKQWAGP
jgi:hypothetical protein